MTRRGKRGKRGSLVRNSLPLFATPVAVYLLCLSMPMPSPLIRRAELTDARAVAALMNAGMTPNVQRLTILGSPLLHAWVADQIASQGGDTFLLAEVDGQPGGMASARLPGSTLVVNHLYTAPAFQRRGVARALLLGIAKISSAEQIALDLFTESKVAQRWYAALGFTTEYRRVWLETRLPAASEDSPEQWSVTGLAEADAAQARHGFSMFRLKTPTAEYGVGRLWEAVFRCVGFAILQDPVALQALATLDARRTLLCIGAPKDVPGDAVERSRVVEQSERLTVPTATLLERLAVTR